MENNFKYYMEYTAEVMKMFSVKLIVRQSKTYTHKQNIKCEGGRSQNI